MIGSLKIFFYYFCRKLHSNIKEKRAIYLDILITQLFPLKETNCYWWCWRWIHLLVITTFDECIVSCLPIDCYGLFYLSNTLLLGYSCDKVKVG